MRNLFEGLRAGHRPSLIGAWLHFEISFMAWLLIGALGVFIAEDFGLTATQKGLLVAVPLLGGALFRIVVGVCSDRFGVKRTGVAVLIGEMLVLLWGWLGATSYIQVLGVGIFLGIAGASFAVALPLASRAYPVTHQGLAMGIAAAGNSGVVLAAFFAPRLGQIVGWHGVFGLMVIPVLITTLLFALLVRDRSVTVRREETWWKPMLEGLRQPTMYWLCFLYAVTFGGFVGLGSFLPIFFHDEYGLNPVTAGTITAVCGLAGSVVRPLGGYTADRLGGLPVLRILFPVVGLLAILVGRLPRVEWAVPLMVMALAAMGFGNGVVFQVVSDQFRHKIGLASGLVGSAGGIGGFFLPAVLGRCKDVVGSYGTGFLLFAVMAVIAWTTVELALRRQRLKLSRVTEFGSISH